MRFILFLLLLCNIGFAQFDDFEEIAKKRVVMIRGTLLGEATFGAGIIAGWENGRIFIFTANHVIRNHLNEVAEGITVEFRDLPSKFVTATVLQDADRERDFAVLAVEQTNLPDGFLDTLPALATGEVTAMKRGDKVYAIGYKDGEGWNVVGLSEFGKLDVDNVLFDSISIDVGASGGGLYNEDWQLIGMVSRTNLSQADALRIDRIQEFLSTWRYPVGGGATTATHYPCKATVVISTSEGISLNQVHIAAGQESAWASSTVVQGGTVTVTDEKSHGGEIWYKISDDNQTHLGWITSNFINLGKTCQR